MNTSLLSHLRSLQANILGKRGMSVIEVVVVLVIVTVGIIGAYQIINSGTRLTNTTEKRIQAISYAREALEGVENIRDTNWLKFSSDFTGCFDVLGYSVSCVGSTPGSNSDTVPRISTGSYSLSQRTNGLWELSRKTPPVSANISGAGRTEYLANFAVYLDANGLPTQSWSILPTALCSNAVTTSCKTAYAREIKITRPDASTITAEAIVSWVDPSRPDPFIVSVPYTMKNWKAAYYSATPLPLPPLLVSSLTVSGVPSVNHTRWTTFTVSINPINITGNVTAVCSGANTLTPTSPTIGPFNNLGSTTCTWTWVGVDGVNRSASYTFQVEPSTPYIARPLPRSISVDPSWNIFANPFPIDGILKITPTGTVSLFTYPPGVRLRGFTSDNLGNTYIVNNSDQTVVKIDTMGISSIHGTTWWNPEDIMIDSVGNIYVKDLGGFGVTRITPAGVSSVYTVLWAQPNDIAIDSIGNIYTKTFGSALTTKVTPAGISSILNTPSFNLRWFTVDSIWNVYGIYDENGSIYKLTTSGVSSILNISNSGVTCMVADSQWNIFVGSGLSDIIKKVAPDGTSTVFSTLWYGGVRSMTRDALNNLYIATYTDKIWKISPSGAPSLLN